MPRFKHSAVDRNRLKRRLREIARTHLVPALPPVDVVIRVLPHAYDAEFDALSRQLRGTVDRLARVHSAAKGARGADRRGTMPPAEETP